MYLKSLEMQGFKSFADKVKLEFQPGITAVIGPNGSGKSNISDGIRWVLGEQSARTLRGAKMEDVIFAGSAERRAVGMAEVSLTLDNSTGLLPLPYAEVTVTRRVFRSGEGEYLINKSPCRLKDVHDLFNDTGLGRESFAIIGQGRVEEVLNSRAEDRRALVEEAAGIIKYRNRKREALKKLEETEQSLARILDIIAELGVNLEPLKAEAEKAEQYQEIKNELDTLELNLAVADLEKVFTQLEKITRDLDEKRLLIYQLEAGYQSLDSQLEREKLELSRLDEELSQIQNDLGQMTNKLSQTENLVGVSEERLKAIIQQMERAQKDLEEYCTKEAQLQNRFKVQAEEHQKLKQDLMLKEQEIRYEEKQLASANQECLEVEKMLEGIKNEIINCLQEIANTKNSYNQLTFEHAHAEQRFGKNQARLQEILAKTGRLTCEKEGLSSGLALAEKKLHEQLQAKAAIQARKKEAELKIQEYQQQLGKLQQSLSGLLSRQQVLKDMEKEHEGYFQGVKSVLQAKAQGNKNCQGICGVVGELIIVRPEYEKAIEVALGGSLQNLVAETTRDAETAIAYLKANHGGRATFLPLNAIKIRELNEEGKKLLSAAGVIGIAAQLVEIAPAYQKVVHHLLGNILVVKDLNCAVTLAKQSSYNVKIVTLEGDIISPGGSITGGSAGKKSTGLLTRPREIRELEHAITAKRQQAEAISRQIKELAERVEALVHKLNDIEQETQGLNLHILGKKQELQNLEEESLKLQKELEFLQLENKELEKELERNKKEQLSLQMRIEVLEAENASRTASADSKRQLLQDKKEKNRVQLEELTLRKVELAALLQKEKSYQTELADFYTMGQELQNLIAARKKEIAELEVKKNELERLIAGKKKLIVQVLQEKSRLNELMQMKTRAREELKCTLNELEQQAKAKFKELGMAKEELHELELDHARLESEKNNGLKRIEERFQLTYEQALARKTDIDDLAEINNRVRKLRRDLNSLGSVNLSAMEEYQRLRERHDFLCKQEQDLKEAKTALDKVIEEIDAIMVKRFADTYQKLGQAFSQVFRELFGGGNAKLELTEPENLLETGIEIIAQPPGKKLQNLTLLSGGERALTAIALLFAILRVKPSPFCVLDEIEASLDEANVDRFAEFLKVFSQKTQFIVISHRQGTIEAADALYGVTMEESGVSKLLSVRLTESPPKQAQSA